MTFTVGLAAGTGGCDHVLLTLSLPNARTERLVTTRAELTADLTREDLREMLLGILRYFIRKRRAAGDTWAQVKTAIEAETFHL